VRCPHCGNENPDDHRFCGMCGKPLPEPTAEISSPVPERVTRREPPTPAPAYTGGIFNLGAPNDAPYQSLDYLLEDEDEPKSHTGLILFGLVALALVVGLGYLRFRTAGFPFPKPRSTAAQTAPPPNPPDSSAPAPDQQSAPAAQPAQPAATSPAPANPAPPSQVPAPAPANPAPAPGTSPSTPPESNTAATPANAAPAESQPPAPENKNDTSSEKESEAAAAAPAPAKPAEAVPLKPKPKPTPKPSDNVALGEQYLYGRGVPQNCERGLRYVKPAADQSNPKAMITMGALYATGHCISRDLPTAYRYFALALRLDPDNGPLRQNAEMVWKQMTAEERKQAIRLTQ
jgi:zinc-ribbon domain